MSDRVEVTFEEAELEGDRGTVPGVVATCTECDHQVESFGQTDRSRRRCLALLREECPLGREDFYVDADE